MPMTATANPTHGTTPRTFTVEVSGAMPPNQCDADASPPNPDPMPDYEITPLSNGNFEVEIKDPVAADTELFFTVSDANSQVDTAVFTSDGPGS